MESEIQEVEEHIPIPQQQHTVDEIQEEPPRNKIGIAVHPKNHNEALLKWTFQQATQNDQLYLIYVTPPYYSIPNPMGPGKVPISQVTDAEFVKHLVAQEAKHEEFNQKLQTICGKHQAKGIFVTVEGAHVGKTLVEQIENYNLCKLVLGASKSLIKMGSGTAEYVLQNAPGYCTVECVSKSSKLVSSRNANATRPIR